MRHIRHHGLAILWVVYPVPAIFCLGYYSYFYGDAIWQYIVDMKGNCVNNYTDICIRVGEAKVIFLVIFLFFGYAIYSLSRIRFQGIFLSAPVYLGAMVLVWFNRNLLADVVPLSSQEFTEIFHLEYRPYLGYLLRGFTLMVLVYFQAPGWYIVYCDGRRLWRWVRE